MPTSGSTYPYRGWPTTGPKLVNFGGLTGRPWSITPTSTAPEDPSAATNAVLAMSEDWWPINVCIGGTAAVRKYSEEIIPREPREDDAAYARRIYHATLPPFLQRLASQAAGTILEKESTSRAETRITGMSGAKMSPAMELPLNEFARRLLVDALLFGHTSMVVDFPNEDAPAPSAKKS